MFCKLYARHHPEFILSILINACGMVINLFSIIWMIPMTRINAIIREILFSFLLANIVGIAMITYDMIVLLCYHHGGPKLDVILTISALLSITHLMTLVIAQYSITTSPRHGNGVHYVGMIFLSWIASLSIGSVEIITKGSDTRIVFAVVYCLSICLMFAMHSLIKRIEEKNKSIKSLYINMFLEKNHIRMKATPEYLWSLSSFAVLLSSYTAFSLPMVMNELYEGSIGKTILSSPLKDSIILLFYSMNFYVPPIVCLKLAYRERMQIRDRELYKKATSWENTEAVE